MFGSGSVVRKRRTKGAGADEKGHDEALRHHCYYLPLSPKEMPKWLMSPKKTCVNIYDYVLVCKSNLKISKNPKSCLLKVFLVNFTK